MIECESDNGTRDIEFDGNCEVVGLSLGMT